jgi:hypothetical protein
MTLKEYQPLISYVRCHLFYIILELFIDDVHLRKRNYHIGDFLKNKKGDINIDQRFDRLVTALKATTWPSLFSPLLDKEIAGAAQTFFYSLFEESLV